MSEPPAQPNQAQAQPNQAPSPWSQPGPIPYGPPPGPPPAGMPPPSGGWPVPPQPQPWGPPVPPPRRPRPPWFLGLMAGICVLGLLCAGLITWGGVHLVHNLNAAVERDRERTFEYDPVPEWSRPAGDPGEEPAPDVTGPRASTYAVADAQDLARVCDGWYYPQSPRFAGKAPHQIQVAKVMTGGSGTRVVSSWVDVPYSLPKSVQDAWWPKNPSKTQLLTCVDMVKPGGRIKSCKFDGPKSDIKNATLKQATYRLRLYEVATGTKLLDKQVTGEDEDCPSFVLVGPDRVIYAEVDDRQLYELLKKYVMKK